MLLLSSSHATLAADGSALAKVEMPFGGGSIEKASAVTGPHAKPIPVHVQGNQIWPDRLVRAREQVSLDVTVKRSAPAAWVAGSTEHLTLTLTTPSASLRTHYLTLRSGEPIVLRFKSPVQAISYGYGNGRLTRRTLSKPLTVVRLHRNADAGTISVAAVPRTWETSSPATVSWFPAGAAASGVVDPAPGTAIGPDTPLTLTFSKPAAEALHNQRPVLTPATAGSWSLLNSHTIRFTPSGYGYGLGANVSVGLPSGVRLVGGAQTATSSTASWKVPPGSTLRLQQILAQLGYLPLRFTPKGSVGGSMIDQEAAAVKPPAGSFDWRYGNVPSALRSFWTPGSAGVMTQGALMAFQNDHGLTTDGVAGPSVWKTLFAAASSGKESTFGYTFVSVDKAASPQSLSVWHSGPRGHHRPGQHRDCLRSHRQRHLSGVRACSGDDDERHQPGRQPLQRPRDPVRLVLQRGRRPPRLHPRPVRVPAEPRLRRDGPGIGGEGVSLHADRDAGSRRLIARWGTGGRFAGLPGLDDE